MIIDNTYFKGDIYIPHAKPAITDSVAGVQSDILEFIADYSRDCLLKCLGNTLFYEFESMLDSTQADGLDIAADAKWDDLLNGEIYTEPVTNKLVTWKGIRFKSISTGNYNRSFLADYVYFYWERNNFLTNSDAGHSAENPANATLVGPTQKTIKAWRLFYKLVQGEKSIPKVINKNGMYGVDWYVGGEDISLYKFIQDSNNILTDKYAEFNPKSWKNMNQYNF